MQLKFSKIIDIPVVCSDNLKRVGTVKDILFVPDTKKVFAIIVRCKKIISSLKVVRTQNIVNVEENNILIKSEDCLGQLNRNFSLTNNIKSYRDEVFEKSVYSNKGTELGIIRDGIFNFETGMLEEIEISDGLVQDLIDGRKIMQAIESMHLEQGIVMIDGSKVQNTDKGLKRLLAERKE